MTTQAAPRLWNFGPWWIGALLLSAHAYATLAPDEIQLALKGCKAAHGQREIHDSNPVRTLPDTAVAGRQPAAPGFPLQLEMRVPYEPTVFPSAERVYLMYELHFTNFEMNPVILRRIEVFDADKNDPRPIVALEAGELDALMQVVGSWPSGGGINVAELRSGQSEVLFLCIAFRREAQVPAHLGHRALTPESAVEGAVVGTHNTRLRVLGPPVKGAEWLASDGPSNDENNHHRRGLPIFGGRVLISRRYAIDWQQSENGSTFSGDALDKRSYFAYDQPVLAVADARIVKVRDGLPDNVPGHDEQFHPAVPITLGTLAGNFITLDLGEGQFAHYLHLKPGSVRVKAGERVRSGQTLASIGSSGDAREPHLHFEVTDSPLLMVGEGMPYLIDRYRVKLADDSWGMRMRELPMKDMHIDFGAARVNKRQQSAR